MSVRILDERDGPALRGLAAEQPEINLFLLGNLETLGFTQPFCTFWGDFDENAPHGPQLRGVANRYFTGWCVSGHANADWAALAALIDADEHAERLQDNPGGTASLLPWLQRHSAAQVHIEELMRLRNANFQPQAVPAGWRIHRAGVDDLDALTELYADAGDMTRTRAGTERPLRDGRVYVARNTRGDIGAVALTNAITHTTPLLAMVGGVYTPPAQRGLGLSKAVCSALCESLLADGVTPVLYWKHPAAGRVYRRLGFQPIGHWRSIWLEPTDVTTQ